MQRAAISHRNGGAYAYAVGPDRLRVVVQAARGDLARAVCFHDDRYTWPPEGEPFVEMTRAAATDLHDFWTATIVSTTRRVRYRFYLEDTAGQGLWLSEEGFSAAKPGVSYFNFPYIHKADAWSFPEWSRRAVFYQIFVDRFYDGDKSNDPPNLMPWGEKPTGQSVAGGDLVGVQEKLPYLKDLGVDCIYFTPIFKAPTNHKYDTEDYRTIDPGFGTNETFKELVAAAHKQGINVLLDAVFNHSGSRWFAFKDVLEKGEQSPYKDWFYNLKFPIEQNPPNYETFATGVASMPKLDTSNPECREYLLQVAEYWIRTAGIDGWRLDVANEVDHGFWKAFRQRVRAQNPAAFILGEAWFDSSEFLQGDEWDSVMNYPWRHAVLEWLKGNYAVAQFDSALTKLRFRHPWPVVTSQLNLLGSHDTARVRTELGGSLHKSAIAAVLLLTSPGIPLIYYADEVGLEGAGDPDCRRCYPWNDEEPRHMGTFELYRLLTRLRHELPWLNDGSWQTVLADGPSGIYAYSRSDSGSDLVSPAGAPQGASITVVLNPGKAPATVHLPGVAGQVDLLAETFIGAKQATPSTKAPYTVGVPGGAAAAVTVPAEGAAVLVSPALAARLAVGA